MYIKDLITQLVELYGVEYDREYNPHPEVMIDVFLEDGDHKFKYVGFDRDIQITRSGDGVYPILTAFAKVK